jgi:hypothetical protein
LVTLGGKSETPAGKRYAWLTSIGHHRILLAFLFI